MHKSVQNSEKMKPRFSDPLQSVSCNLHFKLLQPSISSKKNLHLALRVEMRLSQNVRGYAKIYASGYAMARPLAYARVYLDPLFVWHHRLQNDIFGIIKSLTKHGTDIMEGFCQNKLETWKYSSNKYTPLAKLLARQARPGTTQDGSGNKVENY